MLPPYLAKCVAYFFDRLNLEWPVKRKNVFVFIGCVLIIFTADTDVADVADDADDTELDDDNSTVQVMPPSTCLLYHIYLFIY